MVIQRLFLQNVIAIIWDFDCTLIPGYMQEPLFAEYKVDGKAFWKEVNALPAIYAKRGITISNDTAYLNHILSYVKYGVFKGLNNQKLKDIGRNLKFYPGIPDFLKTIKERIVENTEFSKYGITVENYIVSTGIKAIIEGSAVFPFVDGIWACEFIEDIIPPGAQAQAKMEMGDNVISQIGYMLDNTTKTRAIFEINKGTNIDSKIDVNSSVPQEQRRIPFRNMIYIADGPSDIPSFSIINQAQGKSFAVYNRESKGSYAQVVELNKQRRVETFGEADYTEGTQTFLWITETVENIANKIIEDRGTAISKVVQPPPRHLS